MSSGNDKTATFRNSLIKESVQDKSSPIIFATSQCTLLTLWYSTNSSRSVRKSDFTAEYIPIATLDVEFEILGIDFSPDFTCLVVTGTSPLILIWRVELLGDNIINLFQSKSLLYLFQNNQFNAYNSNLSHPHINVYDLIELPEFQDLYFCDIRELIKIYPGLPSISPKAKFNFVRLCAKQNLTLLVGGTGNLGIYQISLSSAQILNLVDTGVSQEISCIGSSCDNSLIAVITIENELVLINIISGSRAIFSLASDSIKSTFDPITHILFSNFEPDQFAVTFQSGYIILYSISLPDQDLSPNAQISIVLNSSPCSTSWLKALTSAPLTFSPLNRYLLVSISPDCKLATYDIAKRREVKQLSLSFYPTSIAFGANGTTVIIGSEKGTLELYDLLGETRPTSIIQSNLDSTKNPIEIIAFQKSLSKKHTIPNSSNFCDLRLSRNFSVYSNDLEEPRGRQKKEALSNRSSLGFELDVKQVKSYDIQNHQDLFEQPRRPLALGSPNASSHSHFKDVPHFRESLPNNEAPSNSNTSINLRRGSSYDEFWDSQEHSPRARSNLVTPSNNSRERSFTLPTQKRVDLLLTQSSVGKNVNNSRNSRVRSLSSTDSQKGKTVSLVNTGKALSSKSSSLNSPAHSDSRLNLTYGNLSKNVDNDTSIKNDFAKLIDDIVEDKTHQLRVNIKNDINDVLVELLSQFHKLKVDMEKMVQEGARVPELLKYIQVLEEENRRLKLDY